MRVLFTELLETYRIPEYVNISSRKFIMATLAKYLARYKNIDAYFAVPYRFYRVFISQCGKNVEQKIILTHEIKYKYRYFNYHLRILRNLMKICSPDVVVSANIDDFITLALSYPLYDERIKRIVWQDKTGYSYLRKMFLRLLAPSLRKRLSLIAARNLENYKEVVEILGIKTELIPIGIDTEIYRPLKPIKDREYDIIFVARASYEKGVDIFTRIVIMLDKINNQKINIKIITSGGPLEGLLIKLLQRKFENVILSIDKNVPWFKMPEYYSNSLILVNTSRIEVFGQCIAEALACDTHVIATKTPGSLLISKFVKHGIKLVENLSVKLLVDKILQTLSEIREKKQILSPRDYVVKYLSGEAIARKWVKVLSSLCE